MNYQDYQNVRNNTWQILIDCQLGTLPIKVTRICQRLGIKAVPYNQDILQHYGVDKRKNDGFCIVVQGSPFIFFDPDASNKRKRFTIAHELGHIMQGHLDTRHMLNREPVDNDALEEQEANMFAARLLAPACVLWGCHVTQAKQIALLCHISDTAAQYRMKRMDELYEREQRFYVQKGKSCFLQSPLERQVYKQFEAYIKQNQL